MARRGTPDQLSGVPLKGGRLPLKGWADIGPSGTIRFEQR
jgi:hypothetical protein